MSGSGYRKRKRPQRSHEEPKSRNKKICTNEAKRKRKQDNPQSIRQQAFFELLKLLCSDVVPLVLGYHSPFDFFQIDSFGKNLHKGNEEEFVTRINSFGSLVVSGDELFTTRSDEIIVFDANNGKYLRSISRRQLRPNMHSPAFLAMDENNGLLYVNDAYQQCTHVFSKSTLEFVRYWDVATSRYKLECYMPRGISCSQKNNTILIANPGNRKLVLFNRYGDILNVFARIPIDGSPGPWLVAFTPEEEDALISYGNEGPIKRWNLDADCLVCQYGDKDASFRRMVVSGDELFAIDNQKKRIELFDLSNSKAISRCIQFSNDVNYDGIAADQKRQRLFLSDRTSETIAVLI